VHEGSTFQILLWSRIPYSFAAAVRLATAFFACHWIIFRIAAPEKDELRRLKRELEITRQERDILKKAVAIFSRPSR